MSTVPFVLLTAGGTAGHLFPAEALAVALSRRNIPVDLATDERATRYGENFPARTIHMIPSDTVRGRNPVLLARTMMRLGAGVLKAWRLLGRLKPAAVVGFGGYPSIPAMMAATLRGIPTVIHEQNAVMGRANRLLAPRVTMIATSFPAVTNADPRLAAKSVMTGNPVRPNVVAAAQVPYPQPDPTGPLHLLVFGGSQGARIMADVVPAAIGQLDARLRARLSIVQQARAEDLERVRESYASLYLAAEVETFFDDLPARIAAAHLVICRAGASTVAELSAIGRPSILVPLPHALDQDQLANATVLQKAGGARLLRQERFTPEELAAVISALGDEAGRLVAMAAAARSAGAVDAADRLAQLVIQVAGLRGADFGAR